MRVCAEGVEDPTQLHYLRQIQCDEAQGFYFGRPVSAEAFTATYIEDSPVAQLVSPLAMS